MLKSPRQLMWALAALLVLMALLGWHLNQALHHQVRLTSELANRSFSRLFVNQNWDRLRPDLMLGQGVDDIRNNPALDEIDSVVRQFARGTDLIKVKVLDARGIVLYSSERSQIGQSYADSDGFLSAVKGTVHTVIEHKNTIFSFDGQLSGRDTISSYVPVKGDTGTQAVVEVYTDYTQAMHALHRQWWQTMSLLMLALLLFGALFWWLLHQAQGQIRALRTLLAQRSQALQAMDEQVRLVATQGLQWMTQMVTSLQNHVQALRSSSPQPMAASAEGSLHAMEGLLADGRLMSALQSGEVSVVEQAFALGDLVRHHGEALARQCAAQQLECLVHVSPAANHHFSGDADKILKVLSILTARALACTRHGSVQLRADTAPDGVVLDVVDTGEANSPTSASGGLSFDWSLAEGLVRLMGGELKVKVTEGVGSWISLHLPLGRVASSSGSTPS